MRNLKRDRDYDVIVVGARCAGSATAMLLARGGCEVLVVDRARAGSDTLSTHGLMRGGVLQLHRWGLLERIQAAATPPVRKVVFDYPDERLPITIKPSPGVDALYAPRRTVLDRVLADGASEAGAEIRFGVTVTDLVRDGPAVTGVIGRDDRATFRASADLVVGADGIRSTVARLVDAPTTRVRFGQRSRNTLLSSSNASTMALASSVSADSRARPASCVVLGARDGPSSATPGTTRTQSLCTASLMPSAIPSYWPVPFSIAVTPPISPDTSPSEIASPTRSSTCPTKSRRGTGRCPRAR